MIEDYYIPCELYRSTPTTDDMDVKTYLFSKVGDITGVIVQKSTRKYINGTYHYENSPVFDTNDNVLKLDRVLYKGIMYDVTSDPNNVMERNHHTEVEIMAVV